MNANELVDIIRHTVGEDEINKAHEELEKTLSDLDRETLEALCARMAYAIDALTSG